MAKILGNEQDTLPTVADYTYLCRCNTCREWWKMMGPDPDTGQCGGFTMEELGLNKADYPEFLFNLEVGK